MGLVNRQGVTLDGWTYAYGTLRAEVRRMLGRESWNVRIWLPYPTGGITLFNAEVQNLNGASEDQVEGYVLQRVKLVRDDLVRAVELWERDKCTQQTGKL